MMMTSARDHGRGVQTDLPGDEIDRLVELRLQIDDAVRPKPLMRSPVLASSATS